MEKPKNFIRSIIDEDLKNGKNEGAVMTRFPPEPNGYLHIGHAKSICLNFGLARDYNGKCNLRFDDTNPLSEDIEYIKSIQEDVKWLGFDWDDRLFYASNYFEQLYQFAEELIENSLAYVCSLSSEDIKIYRGSLIEPGKESPFRSRSVGENLDLFRRMRNGEFEDGQHVLRAKIDMSSPNMNMRDPIIYRIRKGYHHHRTGDQWCIYPMYDFTHGLSDSLEGITHSICTLEFEDHRPLYDWFIENVSAPCHPQQIEFARLNLNYTVMSKRKLFELVEQKKVDGWNDPRMPTISGMRRRGYTADALRDFSERIGVTKKDSVIDVALLETCVREDLEKKACRVMGVLNPLLLVITNYPDGQIEELKASNHPQDETMGTRTIYFSKNLYIERDDFMEDPPKKFFRLGIGREVRLRYGYYITCHHVVKNSEGEITELHCTYDPETKGGDSPDGRKVKGTIHWVSAEKSVSAEVRLYDRLFSDPHPLGDKEKNFLEAINPDSLKVNKQAKLEWSLQNAKIGESYQFERMGYFCLDSSHSADNQLIFNRTITLRDSWEKIGKML